MGKKKTNEDFVKELNKINPNVIPLEPYSGTYTNMDVRCNICGYEWSPVPKTLLRGIGCPACSGRVPIKGKNDFATMHPELLIDWDYKANKLKGVEPDQYTARSGVKATWECHVCGEKWIATIDKRASGRGCPVCAKEKQKVARISSLLSKNGSLASEEKELMLDWDYDRNSKKGLSPDSLTVKSNKNAHWKCHVCMHEWKAIISNRTKGVGCPVCANKIVIEGINDLGTTNPELIEEWDEKNLAEGVKYTEITSGSEYKAHWKCKYCGHRWKTYVYSRAAGTGCPVCAKRWQSSIPERALFYYIQKSIPNAINGYQPEWIKPSEIDIFIPDINLGIEYDGQAWHKSIKRDLEKDKICKQNGINLLRIREPLCPHFKNRELTYIRENKSLNHIDRMVHDVFDMIERKYRIKLCKDICYERDKENILVALGYHELENNVAQIPIKVDYWDYEKNDELRPEFFSPNSEISVYWACKECGYSWKQRIRDFIKTKNSCPVCSGRVIVPGKNDITAECPDLMKDWDYEKNAKEGIYPNKIRKSYSKKVHWKCHLCAHEWMAKPTNRYYGKTGCPKCWDKKRKGI